jgi:Trk K+ transport system NAD-binding subunit
VLVAGVRWSSRCKDAGSPDSGAIGATEDADAVVVATDGDNTNLVIGQVAQKRFANQCVVVRVLDPARAAFYEERGLRTVCPTQTAISVLTDVVRACDVRPLEPTGSS